MGKRETREATSGGTAPLVASSVLGLPEPPCTADLAPARCSRRWLVVAFLAPLLVYLALVPRFLAYSSPPTGDQPDDLLMTASLVQDGDLDLRNNYEQRDYGKFYERAPHPPGYVGMEAPDPTVRLPREYGAAAGRVVRPPFPRARRRARAGVDRRILARSLVARDRRLHVCSSARLSA